ncbi:MAG: D-2-hydroxyacid dehydrogenase [Eubacteriales bacterium]|nr:D-2-hydroxyacid dehydrogenase [Eubacteriales bacterium]
MKLVVLDGYTLNPGDLSWEPMQQLGELTVYDRTAPEDTVRRIGDAEAVLTNKVILSAEVLAQCPSVRYVGVLATGYNVVDLDYCTAHGIVVTNIPAYSTDAVAQMVMALLLELCLHVGEHSEAVHAGEWCDSIDFCFWKRPLINLTGKTLCVVGCGRIGRAVLRVAQAFGMKTVVVPRDPAATAPAEGAPFVALEEGFRQADVVALCAPLTEQTRGLICARTLSWLKPSAFVINTARGPLAVEQDIAKALRQGTLAGYAADVVSVEPMQRDNPLLGAPNCILTPHIAWATDQTRQRLMDIAVENVRAYRDGAPVHVVNRGKHA